MPSYFTIAFELIKKETVVADFYNALISSNLTFKSGYWYDENCDKNDIIKFLKYETVVNDDFAKLKSKRSSGGMSGSSISLWNPSADVRSFKEQLNEEAFDKYLDVPRLFKLAGKKIGSIFKTVFRSMGFGRQNEIQKKKYEILIKDFYIHYMPMLIGELDAK